MLPGDRPGVAARLGPCGPAVRLSAGDPQNNLQDQHRGKSASLAARDHQDPQQLPTDEAALKLLFLAIRNAGVNWRRPVEWLRFEPSAR